MKLISSSKALAVSIDIRFRTGLMLRSGNTGEFADSEIEMTPDRKKVHISGYVWASLFHRIFSRIKGTNELAREIGNYDAGQIGVSRFWAEPSFMDLIHSDIRPGILINREYGSVKPGGLYSDEIVSPGHRTSINFNWFLKPSESEKSIMEHLLSALHLIDSPIESIGGGWSYGFGRMEVLTIKCCLMDLKDPVQRKWLFNKETQPQWSKKDYWSDMVSKIPFPDLEIPFQTIHVTAKIADGQCLAIAADHPGINTELPYAKLPDKFVFRASRVSINDKSTPESEEPEPEFILPGKALRQALFSVGIERRLKSLEENEDIIKKDMNIWFGKMAQRGLISIADARVEDAETVVLHRIQLCEHTLQNLNLFSAEYLQKGTFSFTIVMDKKDKELKILLMSLLEEMKPNGNAPPGWYRLGMTSTATGQIEVTGINTQTHPKEEIR